MGTVVPEETTTRQHLLQKFWPRNSCGVVDETASSSNDSSITSLLVFTILVASCGSLVSGCAVGYTSPVESEMMSDLSLSTAQFSLFGSLMTAGALLGSLLSGKLTDFLGRKGSMGLSDLSCLAGWASIAFSQHAWSLYLGRLLLGTGLGIFSYVIPIYLAEVTPKRIRGGAVLSYMLVISCGTALMFFVGVGVNWRFLALIGGIPCIIQMIGLFFVPESPRWLVKVGRGEQCDATLQRLRGYNVDVSLEAAEIKEFSEAAKMISDVNFFQLFQRKYTCALTIVLGLVSLGQFCGPMGLMYYASSIFESAGFSTTIGSIGLAIIQVPVSVVGLFLMDKVGRRPLLLVSLSGMGIGCILAGVSFVLEGHQWLTKSDPYLVFVGIMLFFATYPFGIGGVPFIMMSEMFPMNAKGAAGSLATVINWSCAWIVSYAFNFMLEWSSYGTFFAFAFVIACSLLFVAKMVPETKGRSLEEIQESVVVEQSF